MYGSNTHPVMLGRITDAIGADIYLNRPDSAVVLRTGAIFPSALGQPIWREIAVI